jgi:hypothetical protein
MSGVRLWLLNKRSPNGALTVRHAGIQNDRHTIIQQGQCFLDGEVCSLDSDVKLLVVRASDVSARGANFATPAFTNNTSILPSFCETSAYSLSMSARFATSACTASTPLPIRFHRFIQGFLASTRNCGSRALFLQAFRRG